MLIRCFRLMLVLGGLLVAGSVDLDGSGSASAKPIIAPGTTCSTTIMSVRPECRRRCIRRRGRPRRLWAEHITYQAFMPQEFLYRHHRSWHRGGTWRSTYWAP